MCLSQRLQKIFRLFHNDVSVWSEHWYICLREFQDELTSLIDHIREFQERGFKEERKRKQICCQICKNNFLLQKVLNRNSISDKLHRIDMTIEG